MRQRLGDWVAFWRFLGRRFLEDRAPNSAAALTYTSLFAVVPMMTVTFAMLSAIPAFQGTGEQIQNFIFRNFVPSSGEALQEYLRGFTDQARQLTWIGAVLLAVTACMMLMTTEKTFNAIWRVRQPRRGVSSFLLYWAILSLGPLLLGAGFAVTTYVASLSLLSGPHALLGPKTLLTLAPPLFSTAAFTLLYAAVPNTRVPLRHALVGGVFAALLIEVAKNLFGHFVSLFPGYRLIYGAFATVPLFLLWLYLSWLIVLLGAELVCNLSASRQLRRRSVPRALALFGVLRVFQLRQRAGQSVRRAHLRRAGWLLPEDELGQLLDFLEAEQLICANGPAAWVLCRDLDHYRLNQLLQHCPWPLPHPERLPDLGAEDWYPPLREAISRFYREKESVFAGSLASWLDGKPE